MTSLIYTNADYWWENSHMTAMDNPVAKALNRFSDLKIKAKSQILNPKLETQKPKSQTLQPKP